MTLLILPHFIRDLQQHGDANFAKRVLRRVFTSSGDFRVDNEDHRYDGIEDAWIRYVSGGGSAYRAIYIRKGEDVYLYRAGEHSVEDNLTAPSSLSGVQVREVPEISSNTYGAPNADQLRRPPTFLRNQPHYTLHTALVGRRLIPHKEVCLITPYLSLEYLYRTSRIGKAIRDLMEEDTKVRLITRPPSDTLPLTTYEELEQDGVELWFNSELHAKVYAFTVDSTRMRPRDTYEDLVVVGSANLTIDGVVAPQGRGHDELCVAMGPEATDGVETYTLELMNASLDLAKLKMDRARRRIGRC